MQLSPWWSAYAVVLVALVVWIRRLTVEAKQRDADTAEREILLAAMWRAIMRERGE